MPDPLSPLNSQITPNLTATCYKPWLAAKAAASETEEQLLPTRLHIAQRVHHDQVQHVIACTWCWCMQHSCLHQLHGLALLVQDCEKGPA